MSDALGNIFDFFVDKTKSFSHRAIVGAFILAVLVLADLAFGLTYSWYSHSKLSRLERIQGLKEAYHNDTLYLNRILEMEDKIIHRLHYSEWLGLDKNRSSQTKKTAATIQKRTSRRSIFSLFWMVVSSSYIFITIEAILLIAPLFPGQVQNSSYWLGWVTVVLIFVLAIICSTIVAYKLPVLGNKPIYNYLLNASIQAMFWLFVYFLYRRQVKQA